MFFNAAPIGSKLESAFGTRQVASIKLLVGRIANSSYTAIGRFSNSSYRIFSPAARLEIPAPGLLQFERFKQCLKVSLAERFAAAAADDFEKQGGPVLQWFRENL